ARLPLALIALASALNSPAWRYETSMRSISSTGRKLNNAKNIRLYSAKPMASNGVPLEESRQRISPDICPKARPPSEAPCGTQQSASTAETAASPALDHQNACHVWNRGPASIAIAIPHGMKQLQSENAMSRRAPVVRRSSIAGP